MSNSSHGNSMSAVMGRDADACIPLALQKAHSLPAVRKKKILKVKRKLAKDTYEIDGRLSIALDHLLEDMLGQDCTAGHLCQNAAAC